jgi:hypothetical protein
MANAERVALELDAMHQRAKHAFGQKDLASYRELFAPDLEYCQADGRVIGRDQLMRDVEQQIRRLTWFRSSFVREFIEPGEDRANELVTQTGLARVTVFFFVHRIWEVTRRGRYYWRRVADRWRIDRVEVIEEHVGGRFRFGLLSSIECQ